MPAPLLWLGAAALGLYSANKVNNASLKRRKIIDSMPGDSDYLSRPKNGSIVTCGIYGVLDHTGIWFNNNIFELAGSGLIRCVSPTRFLGTRSGKSIYVACDINNRPLCELSAALKANKLLYNVLEYHLLKQNCHKFIAELIAGHKLDITSFSDFNTFLHGHFAQAIRWNRAKIDLD